MSVGGSGFKINSYFVISKSRSRSSKLAPMAANFSPCVDKTILVSLLTIDKEYLFIEFLSGRLKYSSDFARIPPMIINSGLNMLISAAMPRPSFSPISLIAAATEQ